MEANYIFSLYIYSVVSIIPLNLFEIYFYDIVRLTFINVQKKTLKNPVFKSTFVFLDVFF